MSDVEIRRFTPADSRLFETFLRLPRKLYHGIRYWVPDWLPQQRELHSARRNPAFRHLTAAWFLAYRAGEPIGRITAHVDTRANEILGEQAGWFGFFECEDDAGGAGALFDSAEGWLREQGCTVMRGPASFTPHDEWGMLADGRFEDTPTVQLTWNPRYYPVLAERAGFAAARDLYVYELTNWQWPDERLVRMAERVRERTGARLRPIRLDRRNFRQERELLRRFYHEARDGVWGYVPLDDTGFDHLLGTLRYILHPSLCFVAEVDGQAVGASLTLPDVHQILTHTRGRTPGLLWHLLFRRTQFRFGEICTRARVAMVGILPEWRRRGLEALFCEATFNSLIAAGVFTAELGGVPDDHTGINNTLRRIGGRVCKSYRVWERPVHPAAAPDPDADIDEV